MGHRHSKEDILAGALDAALADGLSLLSFGRVAKRLGISDRIVVYYFPTKDDLITAVLSALGARLQHELAAAFTPADFTPADVTPADVTPAFADHVELARAVWPIVARPEADRTFALFFEANGLAAAGREPYRAIVPALVDAWIDWAAAFITGTAEHRHAEAAATIAVVDGLLLLRQLSGPATSDLAAARLLRHR